MLGRGTVGCVYLLDGFLQLTCLLMQLSSANEGGRLSLCHARGPRIAVYRSEASQRYDLICKLIVCSNLRAGAWFVGQGC